MANNKDKFIVYLLGFTQIGIPGKNFKKYLNIQDMNVDGLKKKTLNNILENVEFLFHGMILIQSN